MDKLISSAEAFKVLSEYYHHKTPQQAEALLEALQRVSEAVVRCEECIFFENGIRCGLRNEQTGHKDYCSRGERRSDGA